MPYNNILCNILKCLCLLLKKANYRSPDCRLVVDTISGSSKWVGGTTQSPEVLFGLHINLVPVLMLNILRMRNCRYQESMFTFVAVLGGFCKWT